MSKREQHYFIGGIQVGFGVGMAIFELYLGAPAFAVILLTVGLGLGLRAPRQIEEQR